MYQKRDTEFCKLQEQLKMMGWVIVLTEEEIAYQIGDDTTIRSVHLDLRRAMKKVIKNIRREVLFHED